ncbi:pyridoxamine 5'-phosphate oxidase family protein [Candidatus Pyrohabitans sp.]
MIPEDVLKAFDNLCYAEKPLVWVATSCDDEPHLVPVCFVKALDDGKLLIGNVFIARTERNIESNPRIAVAVAFKREGWDGYLLKGRAEVLRKGEPFESFKREVLERSSGKRELRSALLLSVEEVYSLAPRKGRKRLV